MAVVPTRASVGIFGGAFDPPHLAHTGLIEAAITQLQLSELRVIPTGHAWHKPRLLTDARHRLAMAHLAFDHLPGVQVDEREIHRPGPSYTIDTLRQLQTELPQAQLVLLMGGDQAAALHTWHEAEAIARLARICVADRAGASHQAARLNGPWQHLALPFKPISATEVRRLVAQGQQGRALTHLVAPAVARYIQEHHLYQGVE